MKTLLINFILLGAMIPLAVDAGSSQFNGRWQLVPERSSALDGWTNMHLILQIDGDAVDITHDMRWRSSTRVLETTTVKPGETVEIANYFRVEQRHMAVYPQKDAISPVSSEWLDGGRTLKVRAMVPVETSQGDVTMRIDCEYRLGVGGDTLTLIELHSTRNNPLVYRFAKLPAGDNSRP